MNWPTVPLREVGDWYGGGTPSKGNKSFWTDGRIPWLSPKDMGAEVLAGTKDHITVDAVSNSSVKLVPAGSVAVVVRSGIIERRIPVALVPFETTLNQDMKAVAARPDIDPRWIAWGLRAFERDLLRGTRKAGTTVASIEWSRFLSFGIPVPPLDEQHRIVELLEDHLSRIDAATSYLAGSRKRLLVMERSAMSASREGELVPLGEVTEIQGGIQKQQKRAPGDNAFPFLRVANVTAQGLSLSDVHEVELFEGELERLRLRAGDLLVVEGNGSASQIGRAAVWDGSIADCVHQNHLIRVRPSEAILPGYLEAIWNSPQNRATLTEVSSSSSGLHTLSVSKLKQLSIPVPPLKRQLSLLANLDEIRAARGRLDRAVASTQRRNETLRRALLAAAFSGRLGSDRAVPNVA